MAVFKNELHLDANQTNNELRKTGENFKNVDKKIREAEKGTRQFLAAQKAAARKTAEHAKELNNLSNKLSSLAQAFGVNNKAAGLFGDIVTKGIGSVLKFSTALGGISAALKVSKDAFFANEQNIDDWGRTVEATLSVYEGFLDALNTMDITGYLNRIDDIVAAARNAYNELDRLRTMQAINNKKVNDRATENERMRMMIRTGRYIAPTDGRNAAMKEGTLLSDALIETLRKKLQAGLVEANQITRQTISQTNKAIDAKAAKYATLLGTTADELKRVTVDFTTFEANYRKAQLYKDYEREHASDTRNINGSANPYKEGRDLQWMLRFKDDGKQFQELIALQNESTALQRLLISDTSKVFKAEGKEGGTAGTSGKGGEATINVTPLPASAIIEGFGIDKIELPKVQVPTEIVIEYNLNDLVKSVSATFSKAFTDLEWLNIDNLEAYIEKCVDLGESYEELQLRLKEIAELNKQAFAMGELSTSIELLGGSISSLGSTAAQVVGTVVQTAGKLFGLVGLIMAFAAAQAVQNAFALPFPANIPAYATVISMISSAIGIVGGVVGKFADGGIVGASTTMGDYNLARVNGGEMILNKLQLSHLFNMLSLANSVGSNTFNGGRVEFVIKGDLLYGVLNNRNKKLSRI